MQDSHNIKTGNKVFENVAQFRYLRIIVTKQNYIHEEVKSGLNLWNTCYHLGNILFVFTSSI